ncbi:hypothetical protein ACPV4B_00715 [Vibrio parahaemolyticus]|uniref:hypothetical protein n=1 Tax=Vibrio mediterranei TaxID=689 RepID=UPI00406835CD
MTGNKMNKEMKLLVVAVVIALLNIVSHLLLSKYFTDFPLLEFSLASIPFIMMLLCVFAVRYAARALDEKRAKEVELLESFHDKHGEPE